MDARIGDTERETATASLGDHFAAGRLDHEEYDERLDAIWSARTQADLDQLFADLPHTPPPIAARPTAPVVRSRPPLLPIIVIAALIGVAVTEAAPWLLIIGIVWLVFLRPRRRHAHTKKCGHGSHS